MYAWDRSASEAASDSEADKTDETDKTSETSPEPQAAVAAVQVALDRRDNGGPATAAAPVHAAR
jgi:hypothetical protein